MHCTIYAIAHTKLALQGLEMDVASSQTHQAGEHLVNELDDTRFAKHGLQAIRFSWVAMSVDERHRWLQVGLERVRLSLLDQTPRQVVTLGLPCERQPMAVEVSAVVFFYRLAQQQFLSY
jgi:hypothetical protein